MRCFPFYKPQQSNPFGRIPPNSAIYTGIPYNPLLQVEYKNTVLNSQNANTYTKNQLYSYAAQTQTNYRCLLLN